MTTLLPTSSPTATPMPSGGPGSLSTESIEVVIDPPGMANRAWGSVAGGTVNLPLTFTAGGTGRQEAGELLRRCRLRHGGLGLRLEPA